FCLRSVRQQSASRTKRPGTGANLFPPSPRPFSRRGIATPGHSEPLEADALASWDSLPEWGAQESLMRRPIFTPAVAPSPSSRVMDASIPDGSAAIPLAVAAAASNFLPGSATGGNHLSVKALLGSPARHAIGAAASAPAPAPDAHLRQTFTRTPLSFEANQ